MLCDLVTVDPDIIQQQSLSPPHHQGEAAAAVAGRLVSARGVQQLVAGVRLLHSLLALAGLFTEGVGGALCWFSQSIKILISRHV